MAGIASPGIGSGLDINSLVTQLVAAERAPREARLNREESRVTTQISGLGSLKGALSAFNSALEKLKSEDVFNPLKAAVGDDKFFTATVDTKASTGNYEIEVVALAKRHQLASSAFADGANASIGTGTLTISYGDSTFTVEIDDTRNTLAGLRDAINNAEGNNGVRATLLYEQGGARLVLTSEKTGAANAITVSQTGGDGDLSQFETANLTEMQAAQDAHIRIAGFDHFSETNTVAGAIDGVTLNLKAVSEGETVTLDISYDTELQKSRVNNFITEFNKLQQQLMSLRSYNATTGSRGPLLGDALLRAIEDQIRQELSNPVAGLTGPYTSLASIGITRQVDGSLKLDAEKFEAALEADRNAVGKIFGSENGIAARISAYIDEQLKTGSVLDMRNQALQKQIKTIKSDRETLDMRMQTIEARYRKQFTALDALLAQMQSTSSYLAQQLAASAPK